MGDTVFVNGRAVIHAGSAGKSIAAFPDVCLCPPTPPAGPIPTPLPNNASASDLSSGASTVTTEDNPVAIKSSYISTSTGDETAKTTGGGVVTHVVQGKTYFSSYSMDVLIDGENVPRHLDLTTHNHASPPGNTPPWPWLAMMLAAPPPPPPPPVGPPVFKVVELVEVVTHGGVQTTRAPSWRRQYINVDPAVDPANPHPEYGRFIQFKARLAQVSGAPTAVAGKQVYWYYEAEATNKAGLAGAEVQSFDAVGAAVTQKAEAVDAAGWTPVISFYLSLYGGDKFRVWATEDAGYVNGRKTGLYIVWRQLWFEVDTMKSRDGGLLTMNHAKLPKVYRPVFIRLLKQGKDNKPANTWNLETPNLHAFANDYFGAERAPFQAHEVAVDHQADQRASGVINIAMTNKTYFAAKASYYVYNGGKTWLVSAEYCDLVGTWHPIPNAKVALKGKHKVYKKLRISLDGLPVAPSALNPVLVRYSVIFSDEWSGDGANQPHAMIAMGFWYDTQKEAVALKRTLGTMAHELGHLVGMVPAGAPTYSPGPTGPHCSNADCVMFSTNTPTRKNAFCNDCVDVLRRTDLVPVKPAFAHAKGPKA